MPTSKEKWIWQCDQAIPSDADAGRRLLDEVLEKLESLNWNSRDVFGVHLAVDEALINAIVHGNDSDTDKQVRFACKVSPEKIRVEITDEGPGFDPGSLPDPTSAGRLECPNGRGVMLMQSFMSHVEFRDHGCHVVLVKERSL